MIEPLPLPAAGAVRVQLTLGPAGQGGERSFGIHARGAELPEEAPWTRLAAGVLGPARGDAAAPNGARPPEGAESIDLAELYGRFEAAGLGYGPTFRGLREAWRSGDAIFARVALPDGVKPDGYGIHPALLDAALHAGALAVAPRVDASAGTVLLPFEWSDAELFAAGASELWARLELTGASEGPGPLEHATISILLADAEGRAVARIGALHMRAAKAGGPRARSAPGRVAPGEGGAAWLHTVSWRPAEPVASASADASGSWLLLADAQGAAKGLKERIAAAGGTPIVVTAGSAYAALEPSLYQIHPGRPEDYDRLLAELGAAHAGQLRAVVHAWPVDVASGPVESSLEAIEAGQDRCAFALLHLSQALIRKSYAEPPRLWVVTRGSVQANASDAASGPRSLAAAELVGLVRSIAQELSELRPSHVDLGTSQDPEEIAALASEVLAGGPEEAIALRGASRLVARLARLGLDARGGEPADPVLAPAGDRPFRLEIPAPGALDRLVWREAERLEPEAGEVELEVAATGLNFIDVMKAMGIYPGATGPVALGGECAGRITRVGPGVEELAPGDEVMAVGSNAFGSHVTTHALFVVKRPSGLTLEQAATIPVVFMTAHYALVHRARLQKGESILIHSAAGGTGLAAVQVAKRLGLEIYATAGSEEKRELLRSMGIRNVMDSRSLSFAGEVMKATNGRGVDAVLNSLAGEAIPKSLEVLSPYGRFLELGKRDIYGDSKLGLLPFRKSLAYFAIDLAGMPAQRPELFGQILREVAGLFEDGSLEPAPVTPFEAADVERAFRLMAQAKHVGKIAVSCRDRSELPIAPAAKTNGAIARDGSYLITGGLGGLGLVAAEWLVERGARHLALMGRAAPSEAAAAQIAALEQKGAEVLVLRGDASTEAGVREAFERMAASLPPIKGVIHAAGLLDDGAVTEQTRERFLRVMAPKVRGAWLLHEKTERMPLDFFVLYSSVASVLGGAGQSNYAAANAFLDALAHHRRSRGLTALSVSWGPFADVGMAAKRVESMAALGMGAIAPAEGTAILGSLLERDHVHAAVLPIDVQAMRAASAVAARSTLLEELASDAGAPSPASAPGRAVLKEELLAVPAGERRGVLEAKLRERVAKILGLPASKVGLKARLGELGFDSLMAMELRSSLQAASGARFSATLMFNYPTVAALAGHLAEKLEIPLGDDAAPAAPTAPARIEPARAPKGPERSEEELGRMSDQEAEAALLSALEGLEDEDE